MSSQIQNFKEKHLRKLQLASENAKYSYHSFLLKSEKMLIQFVFAQEVIQ